MQLPTENNLRLLVFIVFPIPSDSFEKRVRDSFVRQVAMAMIGASTTKVNFLSPAVGTQSIVQQCVIKPGQTRVHFLVPFRRWYDDLVFT